MEDAMTANPKRLTSQSRKTAVAKKNKKNATVKNGKLPKLMLTGENTKIKKANIKAKAGNKKEMSMLILTSVMNAKM